MRALEISLLEVQKNVSLKDFALLLFSAYFLILLVSLTGFEPVMTLGISKPNQVQPLKILRLHLTSFSVVMLVIIL